MIENTVPVRSDAGNPDHGGCEVMFCEDEADDGPLCAQHDAAGQPVRPDDDKPETCDPIAPARDPAEEKCGNCGRVSAALFCCAPSTATVEPQPCPSCGSGVIPDDIGGDWQVSCDSCGTRACTALSEAGAIAEWNMLSMTSADAKAHTLRSLFIATSALKSAGFSLADPTPFGVQKAHDIIETALVRLGVAVQPVERSSRAWTCLCDADDGKWWLARRTPSGWDGPWSVLLGANLCLFEQTREYLPDWLSTSPQVVPLSALLAMSSDFYVQPHVLPTLPSF